MVSEKVEFQPVPPMPVKLHVLKLATHVPVWV
jgi:hypothetical protein